MLTNLILIIITFFFHKLYKHFSKKPDIEFGLYISKMNFFMRFFFLLLFLYFFVFLFRFLNLFRQKISLDLNILIQKLSSYNVLSLLLIMIIFLFFIKIFILIFKLNFLKIHFYLMHPDNFKYFDGYSGFFYGIATWPNRFIIFFIYRDILWFYNNKKLLYIFFKHFFTFVMLMLFLYESFFNDLVLEKFTIFLPWYSLYKLLYSFYSYIIYNMDYLCDVVITNVLYSDDANFKYKLYHECETEMEDTELSIVRFYIENKLLA